MHQRRQLKARLRARAYTALATLAARRLRDVIRIRARDGLNEVTIVASPRNAPGANGGQPRLGLWLSPIETAILKTLEDGPLNGRAIAQKLGIPCDVRLRTLLGNLRDRDIIGHEQKAGYFVKSCDGHS